MEPSNTLRGALERLQFFTKLSEPTVEQLFDLQQTDDDKVFLRDICGIEVQE